MLGHKFQLGLLDVSIIQIIENAVKEKKCSTKVQHKVRVKQLKCVPGSALVHPI